MDPKDRFVWVTIVPVGVGISVLGILGNILSMIIWNRMVKRNLLGNNSTALYLIALGACDIGFLIFYTLTEAAPVAFPSLKSSYAYSVFFSWFGYPMYHTFLIAGIWLVVSVTLNRCVLIMFPTRGRSIFNKTRTYNGISLVFFISVAINIPHFFNYRPIEKDGKYRLEQTSYGKSGAALDYHFWCHCIALTLIPWFSILALNMLIVKKLRARQEKMASLTSRDPTRNIHEQQITIMLLTITFTFLGLLGWQCVTQCLYSKEYEKEKEIVWQYVTNSYVLGKLGLVINSAMNCLFYCFAANNFRIELNRMLNCGDRPSPSSQQHQPLPAKQHISRWEEPSKSVSTSYNTSNVMSNLV